jgi:D-sedoheptulose 7-phosphate isomerase
MVGYINGVIVALHRLDMRLINQATVAIKEAKHKTVYTFGNGGSSATASHFAGDLSKGCGIKAFCLTDSTPLISAWANDNEYAEIFEKQVESIVQKGDVVIGISGSGNSENILKGIKMAKFKGATTIGLTAFNGGKLKYAVDIPIIVPVNNLEQAEDIALMICHIIKGNLMEKK